MRKTTITLLLGLGLITPFNNVQAKEPAHLNLSSAVSPYEGRICEIHIDKTSYKDTSEYTGGSKYLTDGFIPKEKQVLSYYYQYPEEVEAGIRDTLLVLQNKGVDLDRFLKNNVRYHHIDGRMNNFSAHYVTNRLGVNVFLYGAFGRPESRDHIYLTSIHELGHYVEEQHLSGTHYREYLAWRGVENTTDVQVLNSLPWEKNPREVFAEDFTQLIYEEATQRNYINRGYKGNLTTKQKEELWVMLQGYIKRSTDKNDSPAVLQDPVYREAKEKILKQSGTTNKTNELICYHEVMKNIELEQATTQSFLSYINTYLEENDYPFIDSIDKKIVNELIKSKNLTKQGVTYFLDSLEEVTEQKVPTLLEDQPIVTEHNSDWRTYIENTPITYFGNQELNEAYYLLDTLGVSKKDSLSVEGQSDELLRQKVTYQLYDILKTKLISKEKKDIPSFVFTDIPEKELRYRYSAKELKTNNIYEGYRDGRFGWNDNVTREQMVALLYRAFQIEGKSSYGEGERNLFKDQAKVSPSFEKEVLDFIHKGLVVGDRDNYFKPKEFMTEAEFALVLKRIYLHKEGSKPPTKPSELTRVIDILRHHNEVKEKGWSAQDLDYFIEDLQSNKQTKQSK